MTKIHRYFAPFALTATLCLALATHAAPDVRISVIGVDPTNQTVEISWNGALGANYDLEHSANLTHGWTALDPFTNMEGEAGGMQIITEKTSTQQFYRIAIHPGRLPQITNAWALWNGKTQLRGANIYQRRVYPALDGPTVMGSGPCGPPYVQSDFDLLASLGANYVNISHPGLFSEMPPYSPDTNVQSNLDQLLGMIGRAGMVAVISFRTGPGRSEFAILRSGDWFDPAMINDAVWSNQAAQTAWIDMWRYTAGRYAGQPMVVGYDLMVEPNACEVVPGGPIWDPAQFMSQYGGSLYDWNQLHPGIAAAIRKVDPKTPILVGGEGYSSLDWLPYLATNGDSRTVYTVHQYEPFAYTHQYTGSTRTNTYPGVFDGDWDGHPDNINAAFMSNLYSEVDSFMTTRHAPVCVNEFGVMRWVPGAARFMQDQLAILEERGIGYALWIWECSYTNYSHGVTSFNFRLGSNPENHSNILTNTLLEVIRTHWDLNSETLGPGPRPSAPANIHRRPANSGME